MAIERTTSKAKIEVISRVWSCCLQGSQSCRKLDPRKRAQQVPRSWTRFPALPKTRTQATEPQSNKEQCTSNMMQYMTCFASCCLRISRCWLWFRLFVFLSWVEPGDEFMNDEPVEYAYEDQAFDNSENLADKMTIPSKSLLSLLC